MTYKPASFASDSYAPDRLIAGHQPPLTKKVTLVSGQNLKRGAVVGRITTGGKYTLSASASVDGSQTPDAILVQDCDASAGDKEALVYIRGDFNASALILGTGHTIGAITEGLRDKNIHLITAQSA